MTDISSSEKGAESTPDLCPKCGEAATHQMPLKRVRRGMAYVELWCPNAHGWLVPDSR